MKASAFAPADHLRKWGPGLLMSLTVAAAARFVADHYNAPVMLFTLLIGLAFNFLADDVRFRPGLELASKTLLRAGIVLLGVRITFADIASLGWQTFAAVVALVALTIGSGFVFSRLFGRGWRFAILTGGAVAICGASAALALASVIPPNDKSERNTIFTVVAVTALSTIAMIVYPIIFVHLQLAETQSGFMTGATIHDVAQVVGAGYSISTHAGDTATVIKLLRVALLPVVLVCVMVATTAARGAARDKIKLPLFVVGFVAVIALNSSGSFPAPVALYAATLSSWLLVVAIAALGIKTQLKQMMQLGWRHVAVVVLETVLLFALALTAVKSGVIS